MAGRLVSDFGLDREKFVFFVKDRYFAADKFSFVFLDISVFCITPAGKPKPVLLESVFRIGGDLRLGLVNLGPFFGTLKISERSLVPNDFQDAPVLLFDPDPPVTMGADERRLRRRLDHHRFFLVDGVFSDDPKIMIGLPRLAQKADRSEEDVFILEHK